MTEAIIFEDPRPRKERPMTATKRAGRPYPKKKVGAIIGLHTAAFTLTEARKKRDAAISEAVAAGIPLRKIAEAANVSHQTVANIADRAK